MHREQFSTVATVPVLVLDVSKEFEHDPAHLASLSKQVQEFVTKTQLHTNLNQSSQIQQSNS
jgi:D-arabinose 5-phosphate isomerase GutQ